MFILSFSAGRKSINNWFCVRFRNHNTNFHEKEKQNNVDVNVSVDVDVFVNVSLSVFVFMVVLARCWHVMLTCVLCVDCFEPVSYFIQ